ncbi:MAG: hypothetical protein AAF391_09425, partial [Bacteroidota bacterium]
SRTLLQTLSFQMTASGYHGIYRYEVFENEDLVFVVCMDKCFFESYVYPKHTKQPNDSILTVVRAALNDQEYLAKELEGIPKHAIFEPNRCVQILVDNYEQLKKYLIKD